MNNTKKDLCHLKNEFLILVYFLFPEFMNAIISIIFDEKCTIYLFQTVFVSQIPLVLHNFLFSVVSLFLFYAIKNKKIFIYVYVFIAYIPSFLNAIYATIVSQPIDITGIGFTLNTDPNEAMHFIVDRFNICTLIVLLLYIIAIASCFWVKKTKKYSEFKKYKISLILALFILMYRENLPINRIFNGIIIQISQLNEISNYSASEPLIDIVSHISEKKQTYIIVIGESVDRKHMSIYGYERKTTPNFDNIKDELHVFKNPKSAFPGTTDSVREALRIHDDKCRNVINFMKDAGFKVFWFSNQGNFSFFDNQISKIAKLTNEQVFLCHTHDFDTDFFDEELLKYLDKALADDTDKKVIFLHLIGSHTPLTSRYTKQFDVFKLPDTYNDKFKATIVCYYDNSILYTDYVLKKVIDKLRRQEICSCLLYFSDHGQDIYDTPESKIYREISDNSPHVYSIPLIVWASEKYKALNRKFIQEWDLEKHYVIDNLAYSIIDLLRLDHKILNRKKSIFYKE